MLGALGAGALGLAGCNSTESDPSSRTGFAGDTEVKTYPVHLKLYVDSYLQWRYTSTTVGVPKGEQQLMLDSFIKRYQLQNGRAEVTIEVVYLDTAEIVAMAYEGFPDGDGIIAMKQAVLYGCANDTLEGGVGNLYVRDTMVFDTSMSMVRAVGSEADLPPAATLTGENAPDGSINQLQQLPKFDGIIALADPAVALEGRFANASLASEGFYIEGSGTPIVLRQDSNSEMTDAFRALARNPTTPVKLRQNSEGVEEFYLEGSWSLLAGMLGGNLREDIADKFVTYPSQDAAMAAVVAGECQLGYAFSYMLKNRYPELEAVGGARDARAIYQAATLAGSAEPGVMRDFFEFVTRIV